MKYWISAFVHLAVKVLCMLPSPHGNGQVQGRDGVPTWQGQGRQALLVDHKDHTQLGYCSCDGESHTEPERKEGRYSQISQDCWGSSRASVMLDSALY